jgi:hypothetical protein
MHLSQIGTSRKRNCVVAFSPIYAQPPPLTDYCKIGYFPRCCFSGPKKHGGGPPVSSDTSAACLVYDVRCVGLQCLLKDQTTRHHLVRRVRQHLGSHGFHNGKKVKVAANATARFQQRRNSKLVPGWYKCIVCSGIIMKKTLQ